jgi:hypothetical protein
VDVDFEVHIGLVLLQEASESEGKTAASTWNYVAYFDAVLNP